MCNHASRAVLVNLLLFGNKSTPLSRCHPNRLTIKSKTTSISRMPRACASDQPRVMVGLSVWSAFSGVLVCFWVILVIHAIMMPRGTHPRCMKTRDISSSPPRRRSWCAGRALEDHSQGGLINLRFSEVHLKQTKQVHVQLNKTDVV